MTAAGAATASELLNDAGAAAAAVTRASERGYGARAAGGVDVDGGRGVNRAAVVELGGWRGLGARAAGVDEGRHGAAVGDGHQA